MPVTRVGVQAVTGSPGQIVDIDPARISATITNVGTVAVEYSTGGAWTAIAAGGSASISCDTHDLRLRRTGSGAYPAPVDIDWTAQSEGEANSLTASQAAAVSGVGNRWGGGVDPLVGTPVTSPLGIAVQSGGASTSAPITGPEGAGLRVDATNTDQWIEVLYALPRPMPLRQVAALIHVDPADVASVSCYVGTNAGYSQFLVSSISKTTGGGISNTLATGVPILHTFGPGPTTAWTNASALDLDEALFSHLKFRITPVAGRRAGGVIYRIGANPSRKTRIVITSDDGRYEWYRTAIPLLQARGLRCSHAIIHSMIGFSSSYMTVQQLAELKAAGHEHIVHGPIGGAGSLIDNYTGPNKTADRVADMISNRDGLVNLGLIDRNSRASKCYIWPQGKFQDTATDTVLLDAAQAAGFLYGRTVNRFLPTSVAAMLSTKYGGQLLPIVGHARGSTSVAEDAEISNITTALTYAVNNGLDAILMFHLAMPTQGTFDGGIADNGIQIEVSRLKVILDAITGHIGSGKAENVLFSELFPA